MRVGGFGPEALNSVPLASFWPWRVEPWVKSQTRRSVWGMGRAVFGGGGKIFLKNARGAQENLWPKFFLWSAPLRATSSVSVQSTLAATLNLLKTHTPKFRSRVGIAAWRERFTFGQVVGNITAELLWKSSKSLEGSPFCCPGLLAWLPRLLPSFEPRRGVATSASQTLISTATDRDQAGNLSSTQAFAIIEIAAT